jgi:hypothetical protein
MPSSLDLPVFPVQEIPKAKISKRVLVGVVLVGIGVAPPLFGLQALLGQNVFTMVLFGIEIAILNTIYGNLKLGLMMSVVYLLFLPVSVVSGSIALAGACLMALACLAMGISSRWQRFGGFYTVPLGMAFVMTLPASVTHTFFGDPAKIRHLLIFVGATAAACVWSSLATHVFIGSVDIPFSAMNPKGESVHYTVVMAVVVSVSSWWVLTFGVNDHGVWLILTLLIVLQMNRQTTRHKILHRTGGTVCGAIFAALVVGLGEPHWFVMVVFYLMLIGTIAFLGQEPYAVFVFFLTNVVLLGLNTGVVGASVDRLVFTLVGVAISLAVVVVEQILFPTNPEKASASASGS